MAAAAARQDTAALELLHAEVAAQLRAEVEVELPLHA